MKMFFVLLLVSLTSILSVSGAQNETLCDYKFGDPTWNFSTPFFDQDVKFPAGTTKHTVVLPDKDMISFVCINLPDREDIDKNATKAAYHPLQREVSVVLAEEVAQDFVYHVFAKRHGY